MSFSNSGPNFWHGQKPSTAQWNGAFLLKVDASDGFAVNLTSFDGEFTRPTVYDGLVTLARNPVAPNEATTKAYVDALIRGDVEEAPLDGSVYGRTVRAWTRVLPLIGGQMTGPLVLAGLPTLPTHAANKAYVDAMAGGPGGGIGEAPMDGLTYGRNTAAWARVVSGAQIDIAPPPNPVEGELWWDAIGAQLYLWYTDPTSSQWVAATNTAGLLSDAPADGTIYGRIDHNWVRVTTTAGVSSFNGRAGTVTLLPADIITALGYTPLQDAPVNSLPYGRENNAWVQVLTQPLADARYLTPAQANALYIPATGGSMTGPLNVQDPLLGPQATNKDYVDAQIGALRLFMGTWEVASNTPDIATGASDGDYFIAVTVNPNIPEVVPPGIPGISGMTVDNGDMVIWNDILGIHQLVRGGPLNVAEANGLYLALDGSNTMAGHLDLGGQRVVGLGAPLAPGDAVTLGYADATFLIDAPADGNIYGRRDSAWVVTTAGVQSFNTRVGAVTLNAGDVTTALGFTPYNATNPSGFLTDAPTDGATYGRQSGGWAAVAVGTAGVTSFNTRTGAVTLAATDVTGALGFTPADAATPFVASFDGRTGAVTLTGTDVTNALGFAPIAGPVVSSFDGRTGAVTLASADVTNALGFTPYNATNPAGYQTASQVGAAVAPYLLRTGGTITGSLAVDGGIETGGDIAIGKNIGANDFWLGTIPGDWNLINWDADWWDGYNQTTHLRVWQAHGLTLMELQANGALDVLGPIHCGSDGRVIVEGNASNPSVTVWDAAQNAAAGMLLAANDVLMFANMNGDGTWSSTRATIDPYGHFTAMGRISAAGIDEFGLMTIPDWRLISWAPGWWEGWDTVNGMRGWFAPGGVAGGMIMELDGVGNLSIEGGYYSWSDRRLKRDIEDAPHGLDHIRQLRPVTFKRNPDGAETEIGFIADEVRDVLPEAVRETERGGETLLTMAYTMLTAVMVNAMQEMADRLEAVEAIVNP